jgi:hypothetical protein
MKENVRSGLGEVYSPSKKHNRLYLTVKIGIKNCGQTVDKPIIMSNIPTDFGVRLAVVRPCRGEEKNSTLKHEDPKNCEEG